MSETPGTEHLFPPFPVPEDLSIKVKEREWPDGLLQRLIDLRLTPETIESWLESPQWRSPADIERWATNKERLRDGTLRARKADVSDYGGFSDLWANSPIEMGDWEVTVERSPNAFAQWRLQENVVLNLLEDRGLIVASQANSRRDTLVDGQRVTVALPGAYRVRKEFRRNDYSQLVRGGGGGPHPNSPVESAQYFYVRTQNFTAYEWMKSLSPRFFSDAIEKEGQVPGLDVWILLYPATSDSSAAGLSTGSASTSGVQVRLVRPNELEGLRKCVSLINRTHRGLDLFRPYSVEFLETKLNEGFWGAKPSWWPPVYSWEDYYVLEDNGSIVACAGLWDRGRDMREVWRKKDGTEERVVAATALMDFGHAAGHEGSMAALVEFLIAESKKLGRDYLMAPFQFTPKVARLLQHHNPIKETRALNWMYWGNQEDPSQPAIELRRPYTDLGYW